MAGLTAFGDLYQQLSLIYLSGRRAADSAFSAMLAE
jgi:hypothetical protein